MLAVVAPRHVAVTVTAASVSDHECAGAMGIWLFYMQHQFEDVYWERHEEWDYTIAALQGSSYLRLPKVLQWFSGNIGFHHIHHLLMHNLIVKMLILLLLKLFFSFLCVF